MSIMTASIKPVMLVSGIATSTMLYAAITPEAALQSMFGQAVSGLLAELVVRNWAILIALVGLALIYGAFRPEARTIVLWIATLSKLAFIGLVLAYGFASTSAGISIAIDAVFVVLFLVYLALGQTRA
jgi:uncharacterized membrane protein YtjA (UPF0391 family)